MTEKDKIIEELIELKGGVKRAEANPFLITRINQKIIGVKNNTGYLSFPKVAAGFSALIILAVLNFGILTSGSSNSIEKTSTLNKTGQTTVSAGETIPSQVNPYLEFINNQ